MGSQILDDEALARQLQEEEIMGMTEEEAGQNPLLRRQRSMYRSPNRTVRSNMMAGVNEAQEANPRFLFFHFLWGLFEMATTLAIVLYTWDTPCDKPLQYWVLVFSGRFLFLLPLAYLNFRRQRARAPPDSNVKMRSWVSLVVFVWFVIGQAWLYDAPTCHVTSPVLYYYTLTLVILYYISLVFPLLLLLSLCICFPCILLFIRLFAVNPGARREEISQLPTRKFQQAAPREDRGEDAEQPSCSICMENYKNGEELRILPCKHEFHTGCVDQWLTLNGTCPLCRHRISDRAEDVRAAHDPVPLEPSSSVQSQSPSHRFEVDQDRIASAV